jgi:hypothetical protein
MKPSASGLQNSPRLSAAFLPPTIDGGDRVNDFKPTDMASVSKVIHTDNQPTCRTTRQDGLNRVDTTNGVRGYQIQTTLFNWVHI